MTGTHTAPRTTDLRRQGTALDTDAGPSVTETALQTGSDLRHKATDGATAMAHRLTDRVDERRTDLADTARTLQEKAKEFASSVVVEQPQVGHVLEQVTDSAGALISYVETTPVTQMTNDLSSQMRRHPLAFAAGMFTAGFALARVLKPIGDDATQRRIGSGTSGTAIGTGVMH